MAGGRPPRDPWEGYEFIDINSRSGEPSPQRERRPRQEERRAPSRSRNRRPSTRERSRSGTPPRGRQPRGSPPNRRPPQRPPGKKRPRKPLGKAARRFLMVFTLLVMVAVTAFACVFLVFKIRDIEVTGDTVYEQSTILEVSGYQIGDNLVLLTTGPQEQALEDQLPYIADAQIIRHFPGTLEIHITAAQTAACVASGSQWFNVSSTGKILEQVTEPPAGVMQVTGLVLTEPEVGETFQAQDAEHQEAFGEILSTLADLGAAGDITTLDLTDLYNITMNYQGRIQFLMGSTVELQYKLELALGKVIPNLASDAKGTLDLTVAGDVKKAFFTEGTSSTSSTSSSTQEDGDSSSSEGSTEESGDSSDTTSDTSDSSDSSDSGSSTDDGGSSNGEESSGTDRGGEIPDTIFTG
ncbi:MAG: cell division protein FtsQ/DivIB [Acutalibacter sp.]|jgi:cell division septal protein FtsQ